MFPDRVELHGTRLGARRVLDAGESPVGFEPLTHSAPERGVVRGTSGNAGGVRHDNSVLATNRVHGELLARAFPPSTLFAYSRPGSPTFEARLAFLTKTRGKCLEERHSQGGRRDKRTRAAASDFSSSPAPMMQRQRIVSGDSALASVRVRQPVQHHAVLGGALFERLHRLRRRIVHLRTTETIASLP